MAIARDANSAGASSAGTTVTVAHTITGTNTILFVAVSVQDTSAPTATFNGTSMTSIGSADAAANRRVFLFYQINPSTGTHNIVATKTSGAQTAVVGSSYTGAKQTGVPDSSNTGATGAGGDLTVSTTVVLSNCWLVAAGYTNTTTLNAGTGANAVNSAGSGDNCTIFDSNGTVGTGSRSMTINSTNPEGLVLASFAPVPPTTNGNFLMFMK